MLDIRKLRYFIAVAEELNFRRAAERLYITQPPLSQVIKQLESELGATLFSRNTHGVQLTRAGDVFLKEANRLLTMAEQSANRVRQAEAGEVGRLRIGYSASAIYSAALTQALATLLEHHPRLDLRLCSGNALNHLHALRAGQLDAAVLRADIANESASGLRTTWLGEEPLYVLLNAQHPLVQAERVWLADLANERLLLQPAQNHTFLRRQIEALAERSGTSLIGALEVPDISSMLGFAMAGIGVAILPKSAALIAQGMAALPLADEGTARPLTLVSAPTGDAAVLALERLITNAVSKPPSSAFQ